MNKNCQGFYAQEQWGEKYFFCKVKVQLILTQGEPTFKTVDKRSVMTKQYGRTCE